MIHKPASSPMKLSVEMINQISNCKYCIKISEEPVSAPISCTKYAGSNIPISVNLATCLTCKEYKQT